jgi:hypothetical protein
VHSYSPRPLVEASGPRFLFPQAGKSSEHERFHMAKSTRGGKASRTAARATTGAPRSRGRSTVPTQDQHRKHRVTSRSRDNLKPWQPGQSGNPSGRQKGARNKLTEAYLADFLTVWERHGVMALEWVAKKDPVAFVTVAATLIPKHAKLELDDFPTVEELIANYRDPNDRSTDTLQ